MAAALTKVRTSMLTTLYRLICNTQMVPSVESHMVFTSHLHLTQQTLELIGETSCTPPFTPMCKLREDSSSLTDPLWAKHVVYEARDDSTAWISLSLWRGMGAYCVVTEGDKELSATELNIDTRELCTLRRKTTPTFRFTTAKKISVPNIHSKANTFPTKYIAQDYKLLHWCIYSF